MADITDTAGGIVSGMIPKAQSIGSGFIGMMAWLIALITTIAILGIVIFFIFRRLKFNKKILIFEKINGVFQPTRGDRCAEVKLSTSGDTIFYCLKHKKYLPNPSIQTGRRIFWYFIREDGEWINFSLKDLDEESKKVGARFLDKEMRYARTQIQKGLKERYDKPSFWQQYGVLVMNIVWIAMIGIMTFLLFDKWIDLASTTNAGVETAGRVLEKVEQVLANLDNICSGSGVR